MSVRVFAPAKINLTLKVGRPRADGYHPLESVVAFADIGDIVEAEAADDLSLTIHGDFAEGLASDQSNLVLRAAAALAETAGVTPFARLSLEKNLPIASGIGGGSSDAASALTALSRLWGLNWRPQRLAEIAARLGADVPVFFSDGGAAQMSGVGEICAPMRMPPLPAVLINPLQPLSTPDVYRQFDRMALGTALSSALPPAWGNEDEAIAAMRALGNDLEAPAAILAPAIATLLTSLRAQTEVRYAALSGSGATCFAITQSGDEAHALAADLAQRNRNWWVRATKLGA